MKGVLLVHKVWGYQWACGFCVFLWCEVSCEQGGGLFGEAGSASLSVWSSSITRQPYAT